MSRDGVGMVGEFSYAVSENCWSWSDTMYEIFGFVRGDVVPTNELLKSHQHPDDAERVTTFFQEVLETGGPYSCYFRILTLRGRVRHVVAVGDGELSQEGRVDRLGGYLVDMTEARRRDAAAQADAAVRGAVQHRAQIEQAKGALMFVYGVDADTAFTLLRAVSQHRNIKVNQLAEQLMNTTSGNPPFPTATQRLALVLQHDPRSLPEARLPQQRTDAGARKGTKRRAPGTPLAK